MEVRDKCIPPGIARMGCEIAILQASMYPRIWNFLSTAKNRRSEAGHPFFCGRTCMSQSHDSIAELTRRICAFRDARDWAQFHSPKELAVALTAEAGELLQHFVWQTPEQSVERVLSRRAEIAGEMADVAILLMELAEVTGIPLGEAVAAKLLRNEERYPVDKARGSNKKHNEL